MKERKRKGHGHRGNVKRKQAYILGCIICVLLGLCFGIMWKEHNWNKSFSEPSKQNRETVSGKQAYNDHLSNFLFLGIDTRNPVETYETQADAGQADAIFLVSLDRITKDIQVLAIPRDTIAEIKTFTPAGKSLGKVKQHINIQYAFGDGRFKSCDLMKQAVSKLLYDLPIQGYCSLNMDGIPLLADLAGGVEIVVPDDSLAEVNPEFQEGASVTLTSDNVEQFLRYRDRTASQSALVRQEHQRVFLKAYLEKAREMQRQKSSFVKEMYHTLQPYMVTNMGNDLFVKLLEASGENKPREYTLPGEGAEGEDGYEEYHVDEDALHTLVLQMFYKQDS